MKQMPERALSLPHQAAPGAPRRERLVFFLFALFLLIANIARAQTLFSDDFSSTSNWQPELENGGSVAARDGKLVIDVPAGCTVWFKPKLAGPLMIEYETTVLSAGGTNDRVSDLNCFWMASDARTPSDLFATQRTGKFEDYNQLLGYYASIGGNSNTTTRFRRYIGDATSRPLLPEHDLSAKDDLLVPNVPQTIRLIADGSRIEFWRDARRVFAMTDPHPYTSGHFGFRTTANHMEVRRFRVYRLPRGDPPKVPPRQMENLGRGVVAISAGAGKVFVSWRMLGTDPDDIAFNVYRGAGPNDDPVRLNDQPIVATTTFLDTHAPLERPASYFVRPVIDNQEQPPSKSFTATTKPYVSIKLKPVALKTARYYFPNDASVGDLDGDGEYEIVLHQAGRGFDNSRNGYSDEPVLQAYKLDGTRLWEINLGPNIREGAHYTQFLVYDFDGDGKAEVMCKTADGTRDGVGETIGDPKIDHTNSDGHVLDGPEYLTIFDGLTGRALATVPYNPPRGNDLRAIWGDSRGNRSERYLAAVAYLDGVRPSAVFCRGYYTRTCLAAWDWRDGKLTQRWFFDSDSSEANRKFRGQGNHNLSVGDVDDDGRDEIVYGGMCIDDNGRGLYSTGLGHGDAMHLGDLDPLHPGLEVFRIQERFDDAGAHMFDARTGEVLWRKPSIKAAESGGDKGEGPGRGVCFDVDPRYLGSESWALGAGIQNVWDARGNVIGSIKPRSCNFAVWWDGDVLRELLDRNHIDKWNWMKQTTDRILLADDCTSNNGTKATPCLSADILGDWREEVIWPTNIGDELRIYISTIPTDRRFYTFMHDPQYRLAIAWQNVAYNQPPHPSFYVGEAMPPPPKPNIVLVKP
jgi:rhamnogalacturonan endolyase